MISASHNATAEFSSTSKYLAYRYEFTAILFKSKFDGILLYLGLTAVVSQPVQYLDYHHSVYVLR